MIRRLLAACLVTALTAVGCATGPATPPSGAGTAAPPSGAGRAAPPSAATPATPPSGPGPAAPPSAATPAAPPSAATPAAPSGSTPAMPPSGVTAATPSSGAGPGRPTAPVIVSERRDGRLVTLVVDSPAVGREAEVQILLPSAWRPGTRWPVLYLLDGCCREAGSAWVTSGRADQVTEDAGVIVVMPEAGFAGFYSDWLDGPQWETFHLTEVRELMERRYGGTGRRAVAGLSMGGFGALSYAARHPGMFRAAASFSGLLDVSRQDVDHLTSLSGDDPGKLWGTDLAAHNPTALAGRLKGIPVHVSCGNGEPGPLDGRNTPKDVGEEFVERENRAFVAAARRAGVKVTVNLYGPGTHRWPYWTRELERALPMLLASVR
ncbi:alpha/beta hydrolase [Nonomuraea sp. NPDC003754]